MRKLTAVGVCAGLVSMAPLAHAQAHTSFGEHGELIVSADRLFPLFSYTHMSQDAFAPGAGNSKQVDFSNQTSISLLWGSSAAPQLSVPGTPGTTAAIDTFFTVPRVGLDYVIVPHFTLGGDLAIYFTLGGNTGSDSTSAASGATTTTSNGSPSVLVLGLAPRAGYILQLTDLFSIWLRGGLSYFVASAKTTTGNGNAQTTNTFTTNQLALDLDPQLVISPFSHVAFTAGLTADVPLTGGHSTDTTPAAGATTSQSASSSVFYFGLTAGLLAYF